MKKIAILCLMAVLFSNCKKKDESILFEMPYFVEFEIPAGLNPFTSHYFYFDDIPSFSDSLFSKNGISFSELSSINPKIARLNSLISGQAHYDFIKEISIYIYEEDQNKSLEVFWHPQVDDNAGATVGIPANLPNVKRYFENDKFGIKIRLVLRNPSPEFISTRLDFSFLVR